jgi:hypothetical protein
MTNLQTKQQVWSEIITNPTFLFLRLLFLQNLRFQKTKIKETLYNNFLHGATFNPIYVTVYITRQDMHNVISRRVRVTIVAMGKQKV